MAEQIIDRTEKLIVELDLSTDMIVVADKPSPKRTVTVSSPKQRRYEQPKTSAPPPLRRYPFRQQFHRRPTFSSVETYLQG